MLFSKGISVSANCVIIKNHNNNCVKIKFSKVEGRLQKSKSTVQENNLEDNINDLYNCTETHCNYTFLSFQDLEHHMDLGQHSSVVNNETV